jgi:hypothetical protein
MTSPCVPTRLRRLFAAAGATAALLASLSACGSDHSTGSHTAMPGMDHASPTPTAPGAPDAMGDMPGMGGTAPGNGLSDTRDGYHLVSTATTLPPGSPVAYRFTVNGPDGEPVTDFAVEQTERLHFYAIRSDLTGFQHIHPTMAADGTWSAGLAALTPGSWRVFTTFTPNSGPAQGSDFVLSRTVTVPGNATTAPLPAAATSTRADGYTVTVDGEPTAGTAHRLTVSLSKDGKPVTDLQPYLEAYAHLTAFHEGDTAFAHLHPTTKATTDLGGPTLPFHAELPTPGNWRLYLQFQTAGTLHTAALTLHVT